MKIVSAVAALAFALAGAGCRRAAPDGARRPPTPAAIPDATIANPAKPANTYWSLVEPHFERVSIYAGPAVFLREYQRTPERARHLLAAHWCVSDVSDGGFLQFFTSATGVLAPEATAGLEALGLAETAAVVREAMKFFGADYPREIAKRNRALEAYKKRRDADAAPFAALDQRFFTRLKRTEGGFDATAAAYANSGN